MVTPGAQDWGDQLKFVMGMASVDVAVLWPKNYGQFDVCYKPTSRLSQFASLGIPVVSYPFGSYIDLFVRPSPVPTLVLFLSHNPHERPDQLCCHARIRICTSSPQYRQLYCHSILWLGHIFFAALVVSHNKEA